MERDCNLLCIAMLFNQQNPGTYWYIFLSIAYSHCLLSNHLLAFLYTEVS